MGRPSHKRFRTKVVFIGAKTTGSNGVGQLGRWIAAIDSPFFFSQRKSMKDLHPISLRDSIPLTPRLVAKHPLALSVFSFVAKKERGIRICTSPCYPTRGIPGLSEMDSSLDSGHCENPFLSSPPPDRRRPDIVPTRGISYPASRIDTTTHHICSCWPRHLAFPAAVIVGDGVGIYSTGQSRQGEFYPAFSSFFALTSAAASFGIQLKHFRHSLRQTAVFRWPVAAWL